MTGTRSQSSSNSRELGCPTTASAVRSPWRQPLSEHGGLKDGLWRRQFFIVWFYVLQELLWCVSKKKRKKRKRYVCTISGLLHSHSQHLINNFYSFVLFFISRFCLSYFKNCCEEKKRKKIKKVCLYNVSAYYICIHSSIVSILFIHLLSTVKKKKEKKPRGRVGLCRIVSGHRYEESKYFLSLSLN